MLDVIANNQIGVYWGPGFFIAILFYYVYIYIYTLLFSLLFLLLLNFIDYEMALCTFSLKWLYAHCPR